jgi:hypothetical protein
VESRSLVLHLAWLLGHANGQTLQGWTRNVYAKGDVCLADVVINFLKDQPAR